MDFKERSIKKYNSVEDFVDSYIKGNEATRGNPYPVWSVMLAVIAGSMRALGLDSEDILNGLEDDLEVIDYFLEMEELKNVECE